MGSYCYTIQEKQTPPKRPSQENFRLRQAETVLTKLKRQKKNAKKKKTTQLTNWQKIYAIYITDVESQNILI